MSAPQLVEARQSDKVVSRMLGEELRRAREALGWSRLYLAEQLPSRIGDRTVLSYEHGTRHLTALRLIEMCHTLKTDAPTVLRRALQRARINIENLLLKVDLHALLKDESPAYRPLHQWAKNTLNEHADGTVEITPDGIRNLALFLGCTNEQLTQYLARFLPDD